MALKTHRSHFKYNYTEVYSIGVFHYIGNNGKLYFLTPEQLDKLLAEMEGMFEAEKLEHIQQSIVKHKYKSL